MVFGTTVWALVPFLPFVQAETWSGGGFSLSSQKVTVDENPYDPDKKETGLAPGTHNFVYGARHRFFGVKDSAGKQGVMWQSGDEKGCFLTWHEGSTAKNLKLPCEDGELMVAATHNGKDSVVFVGLKHQGKCGRGPNGCAIGSLRVVKAKMADGTIVGSPVDLPSGKFNFKASTASMASIEWSNDILALHLASEMPDGHYSARSASLNADTLKPNGDVPQTASHSWGHSMTTLKDGRVWVIDECDNFPRGFPVTEISKDGKPGRGKRMPYRNKGNPSNKNDNNIYNKLAHRALVELDDRVALVFSGEGLGHTSTDGSKASKKHNEAYNLATIIFDKSLTGTEVFSEGPVETGSYLNFNNKKTTITHKGVTWLTKRKGLDKNVLRAKTFKAPDDKVVIIYEEWTEKAFGGKVFVMAIDKAGKIVMPETEIPATSKVRLTPADDIISFDGKTAVFYRGEDNNLIRYSLSVGDAPPDTSNGNSTSPNGSTSTGGNSTGGNSTGGNSTGGNSTEGNSTGGNSTGANSTGSNSTGDNSTGGNSTGSNSSGTNSTGGSSTGSNSTGGSSTGGSSTGDNSASPDTKESSNVVPIILVSVGVVVVFLIAAFFLISSDDIDRKSQTNIGGKSSGESIVGSSKKATLGSQNSNNRPVKNGRTPISRSTSKRIASTTGNLKSERVKRNPKTRSSSSAHPRSASKKSVTKKSTSATTPSSATKKSARTPSSATKKRGRTPSNATKKSARTPSSATKKRGRTPSSATKKSTSATTPSGATKSARTPSGATKSARTPSSATKKSTSATTPSGATKSARTPSCATKKSARTPSSATKKRGRTPSSATKKSATTPSGATKKSTSATTPSGATKKSAIATTPSRASKKSRSKSASKSHR